MYLGAGGSLEAGTTGLLTTGLTWLTWKVVCILRELGSFNSTATVLMIFDTGNGPTKGVLTYRAPRQCWNPLSPARPSARTCTLELGSSDGQQTSFTLWRTSPMSDVLQSQALWQRWTKTRADGTLTSLSRVRNRWLETKNTVEGC